MLHLQIHVKLRLDFHMGLLFFLIAHCSINHFLSKIAQKNKPSLFDSFLTSRISALSQLNGSLGINTSVTTGATYVDFNVYYNGMTFSKQPKIFVTDYSVNKCSFRVNAHLKDSSGNYNGIKLQAFAGNGLCNSAQLTIDLIVLP